MDVRIIPLSDFSSPSKIKPKFAQDVNRNHFVSLQKQPLQNKTAAKKTDSTDNHLTLSTKSESKPQLSLKMTSSMIQPPAVANKKGILLYQQVERDKLFSDDSELINRFNTKV